MDSEEEYMRRVQAQQNVNPYIGADKVTRPPMTTITQDAEESLTLAHRLHNLLDQVEERCFPPQPMDVTLKGPTYDQANEARREPIGSVIRHTRQRLDSAIDRFEQILQRL